MAPLGETAPIRKRWSSPQERIYVQLIHWGVVTIVVMCVFVLAIRRDIDKASITALYGGVLGHAATAASQKLSTRGSDHGE